MKESEGRIEKILSEMTLEEKIGQMQQISWNAVPAEVFDEMKKTGMIGSYLHVLGTETDAFDESVQESRLHIPPLFGIDAIHGHALLRGATVFPSQLALACSFDDDLVEEVGHVTAAEVAADGLDWVFSPVLCIGRDLRWGRVDETFGEDACLVSRLGAAIIRGYQKDGLVAACAKHYFGYGEATGGRDSYDSEISDRKAYEVFLKPFQAAIDAGCMTVMVSYGSISGTPLTTSEKWVRKTLKEEMGFDGFVVSDWCNFQSLIDGQKVANDMEESSILGIVAGVDMSMNSYRFFDMVQKSVQEGRLSERLIDDAVRRILHVKAKLGLLDSVRHARPMRKIIGCEDHQEINYKTALESAVLLKNNGVLPIKIKSVKKIAVVGPNADDIRAQYGDWTFFSHPEPNPSAESCENVYTILKGIKERFVGVEIVYAKGCTVLGEEIAEESEKMMQDALDAARDADIVIAVVGDNLKQNGEGRDRAHLVLSGRQEELVARIKKLQKRVVSVLVNGKPLVLSELEKNSDAIVETFNGGDMCGLAIADLLCGKENFSGRLPISFPYDGAATPCYYNQYDYWHGGKYIDVPAGSPYPFGFGLSYTKFEYSEPVLSKNTAKKGETITLSVKVTNAGKTDGTEVIQLYFRDKICKVLTPVRSLMDYKRVTINAGESAVVSFEIHTDRLGYYSENCEYTVDSGMFEFFVSGDGIHFCSTNLNLL